MINISPVNVPKAGEVLADLLREKILDGEIAEATNLPNERELTEQTGLSRASVREALRILEGEGLIVKRLGRNGGSAVVRPTSAAIERSVGLFIRGKGIRLDAVLQTRAAIEPPSAHLAAQFHTAEDFEELEFFHSQLERASAKEDLNAYVRANLDWHVQVVRAGHNELMIAFISAISRSVYAATDIDGFNSKSVRTAVIHAHRRVMDAIKARDADAAARRMARHVGAYISHVESGDSD